MTSKNNSTENCQDNPHIDESTKSRKIKEVHFRISQKSLEKWDDYRKIRNQFNYYFLFLAATFIARDLKPSRNLL